MIKTIMANKLKLRLQNLNGHRIGSNYIALMFITLIKDAGDLSVSEIVLVLKSVNIRMMIHKLCVQHLQ